MLPRFRVRSNAGRTGRCFQSGGNRAKLPHRPMTHRPIGQETTMQHGTYEHIAVDVAGNIATIEVRRGPNNFIDTDMVAEIADALEIYDRTPDVRAIVL